MTAPTRIIYGPRNVYALDPYVRDNAGRFAPRPPVTPAPIQLLEDTAEAQPAAVRVLYGGAMLVCDDTDGRNRWRVRTVREDDGSFRVIYLED